MTAKLMENMRTPVTSPSKRKLFRRDKHRIIQAAKARSNKEKKELLAQQLKAAEEDEYREAEGVSYAAGTF